MVPASAYGRVRVMQPVSRDHLQRSDSSQDLVGEVAQPRAARRVSLPSRPAEQIVADMTRAFVAWRATARGNSWPLGIL